MKSIASRWIVRVGAGAVLFSLGGLTAGCSGGGSPKSPAATVTETATTKAIPMATVTPPPTPLSTVEPPALKLRLVSVATGANSDLPVTFGRKPAWSPDSKSIAVVDDEGLSFGALTDSRFRRLWKGYCGAAGWSPSGDRIAAYCGDGVVIVDTTGRVIARDESVGGAPVRLLPWLRWSLDGSAVAFGSMNSAITVMTLDGTRTTVPGSFASAKWLPDGRLLTVEQPGYMEVATIRIHDPARDYAVGVTMETPVGAAALGFDREGKYAAYGARGSSGGDQRVLPSTVTVLRIADGQVMASFPTYAGYGEVDFSPDGRSILMQSDFCGPDWAVEVGGLDGSRRVVASGPALYTKFSPDGAQVGILAGLELRTVPADGSSPARLIAEGLHGPAGFDWSPDGKWISVPPFFGGFGICH